MFEHFSFPSPSSRADDDRLMADCDSAAISPLSSRCPSPSPYLSRRSRPRSPYVRRHQPPPTSMPSNYEQFQRRISVGTLTEKLNAHTLNNTASSSTSSSQPVYETPLTPVSPTSFSFSVTQETPSPRGSIQTLLTPPGEYEDEGYDEQMTPGWDLYHHASGQFAPYPTSMPVEHDDVFLHPPTDTPHRYSHQPSSSLRSQRQQMSRAQCNIDVLKLALMAEGFTRRTSESPGLSDDECHPSSMPLETRRSSRVASGGASSSTSLRYRSRASAEVLRRRSTPSTTSTFASSTRIHKSPRLRALHTKKSEQTLRRKSLVCATLASTMCEITSRSSSP